MKNIRIKLFNILIGSLNELVKLEKQVNLWLSTYDNLTIVDIKYQLGSDPIEDTYSVMIIYEMKQGEK